MELRTYTGLWNVEKRLYKFYDINLPYPVSFKQLGIALGSAIPWFILMAVLKVPFASPWHAVWLGPPIFFAYWGNKPVTEGKNMFDYLFSQMHYWTTPHKFADLTPGGKEGEECSTLGEAYQTVTNSPLTLADNALEENLEFGKA